MERLDYNIMDTYLSRPLPVIIASIKFTPRNIGPPPIITFQIDFTTHINNKTIPLQDNDIMDEPKDTSVPGPEKTPDYNTANIPDDSTPELIAITKIPKPNGEPGRPHSGGYSLEVALGNWAEDLLQVVNVSIDNCHGRHI